MFCGRCGSKLDDDAAFCTKCGARTETAAQPAGRQGGTPDDAARGMGASDRGARPAQRNTQSAEAGRAAGNEIPDTWRPAGSNRDAGRQAQPLPVGNAHAEAKKAEGKKNSGKKLLIVGAAAVAVIAVLAAFLLLKLKTIKLMDYAEINFSGVDGYASAEGGFSYDLHDYIYEALGDAEKETSAGLTAGGEYAAVIRAAEVTLDKSNDISNGDEIKMTVKISDDYKGSFKLKGGEKTFKAEDLTEAELVDMFKGVTVNFDGIDGEGSAKVEVNNDYKGVTYTIKDYRTTLSNGDVVTVVVRPNSGDFKYYANQYGLYTEETEKEVTVSGLAEVEVLDAFDPEFFNVSSKEKGIHIEFSGMSPEAELNLRSDLPMNNPLAKVTYTAKVSWGQTFANGDELVIEASIDDAYAKQYRLKETTTTVICENIDGYMTDVKQLSDESLEQIKEQCLTLKKLRIDLKEKYDSKDAYYQLPDSAFKTFVTTGESLTDFKWEKAMLYSVKDGYGKTQFGASNLFGGTYCYNRLYIVYSFKVSGAKAYGKPRDGEREVWGVIYLHDCVAKNDGTSSVDISGLEFDSWLYLSEAEMMQDIEEDADIYFEATEMPLNWN